MDPTEVWAALQELVQGMQTIEYLLGITKTQTKKAAQENVPFTIETSSAISAAAISDGTIGLAAISADISDGFTAVLAAITAVQQAADPVILPTIPPTGYQAPSSSDNANEVWNYSLNPFGNRAQDVLEAAGEWGGYNREALDSDPTGGHFYARFRAADWVAGTSNDQPVFDPTDILPTETALECVARQNPTKTCTWWQHENSQVYVEGDSSYDVWQYFTTFDQAGFNAIREAALGSETALVPPVWPGIDLVTLGTPQAITSLLAISAEMDGVLIEITDVGTNKPPVPYGDQQAWRYLGALAFVTDIGDVETWQQLAFQNAIYSCKSIHRASGVVLRATAGLAGTVTPWTLTS